MNNIAKKQNELEMLRIQYSARHCYNFAGILNRMSWLLCIISSVILNLPCVTDRLPRGVAVIGAIIAIVVIAIDFWKKHLIRMGAALKKLFDYKLFGFDPLNEINGFSEKSLKISVGKIITRYPKSCQKQISHSGTDKPNGVKDWYNEISPELSSQDAIQKCQRENLHFDTSLVTFTQWIYIAVLVLLFCVLILLNFNLSYIDVIIKICSMISLVIKIVTETLSIYKLKITLNIIKSLSYTNALESQVIQKMIDERRNVDVTIPGIVYKINSRFLHLSFKNADSVDI